VAIFTKFDDFITQVYDEDKDEDENRRIALDVWKELFEQPLTSYKSKPSAYMHLECRSFLIQQLILGLTSYPALHKDDGKHEEQVGKLIKKTAASINDLALKMLFVTIQQNNLEVSIEWAVNS